MQNFRGTGEWVKPGVSDLTTALPNLVTERDYGRNSLISPSQVSHQSDRKVFWLCAFENSYDFLSPVARGEVGGDPSVRVKKFLLVSPVWQQFEDFRKSASKPVGNDQFTDYDDGRTHRWKADLICLQVGNNWLSNWSSSGK